MVLIRESLQSIIEEELTKGDVSSMIASKFGEKLNSQEFKRKVKELASDVVNELFKMLWQRNSFWKNSVIN